MKGSCFAIGLVIIAMIPNLGCSSLSKSMMLGAGAGAATGVGSGLVYATQNRSEAALVFGGIGALVGVASFYLFHKELDKRDESTRMETILKLGQEALLPDCVGAACATDNKEL